MKCQMSSNWALVIKFLKKEKIWFGIKSYAKQKRSIDFLFNIRWSQTIKKCYHKSKRLKQKPNKVRKKKALKSIPSAKIIQDSVAKLCGE